MVCPWTYLLKNNQVWQYVKCMRFVKICRILAYSELCLFTYMQEFSSILSIKAYSQILKSTLCNLHIFTTLPYFQPWHIENQRYIQNPVKLSQGIFRTLPLLEQSIQALFNHIQTCRTFCNACTCKNLAY